MANPSSIIAHPARPRPFGLIVLDGWGISSERRGNAAALARTPTLERLFQKYPNCLLDASGEQVGLPAGQMGNSEVGHLNIGAGRIVYQDLVRIGTAIEDGSFFENPAFKDAAESARAGGSALHLIGLVSDGGVHSHLNHLVGLLDFSAREGLAKRTFVHAFLDGRDTPPRSALEYLDRLEQELEMRGMPPVSTVSGRYYAMDRDRRWERTKLAYDALIHGKGEVAQSARGAVERSYAEGAGDEFVRPTVILRDSIPARRILHNDAVIFFNFRADRARQLTLALTERDFSQFDRGEEPPFPRLVTLTEYDPDLRAYVAFPQMEIRNTLADVLAAAGMLQLHIAETEKYAHVTYFFNGGKEAAKEGEVRVLIPSPKVATYDLKPEMSAPEVTDHLVSEIRSGRFDFFILNYANPDMVGHTGFLDAAVSAMEAVDDGLRRILEAVQERGGEVIILGDHGNVEQMVDEEMSPQTAHSVNPVPLIYTTEKQVTLRPKGILADVAPTILQILGLPKPGEMTGVSLLPADFIWSRPPAGDSFSIAAGKGQQ